MLAANSNFALWLSTIGACDKPVLLPPNEEIGIKPCQRRVALTNCFAQPADQDDGYPAGQFTLSRKAADVLFSLSPGAAEKWQVYHFHFDSAEDAASAYVKFKAWFTLLYGSLF